MIIPNWKNAIKFITSRDTCTFQDFKFVETSKYLAIYQWTRNLRGFFPASVCHRSSWWALEASYLKTSHSDANIRRSGTNAHGLCARLELLTQIVQKREYIIITGGQMRKFLKLPMSIKSILHIRSFVP